jgi:hypothetical protein
MALNSLAGFTVTNNIVSGATNAINALSSGSKVTTQTNFRYPKRMLDGSTDYLFIKIYDNEPKPISIGSAPNYELNVPTLTDTLNNNTTKKTNYTIVLPVPQTINDQTSVTWGEDTINALEGYGLGAGNNIMSQGFDPMKSAQGAVNAMKNMGLKLGNDANLNKAVTTALSGYAVNSLGGNVSVQGLITRATGQVLNTNLELLFQAVNLRTFSFSFDFAPRDYDEGQEVRNIIRALKKSMAARGAQSGTKAFISSPSVFQLQYKSGGNDHPFLNVFKPCALTDMSINYTGSNTYTTYYDGTPVHLTLTLTFKEVNPIYAEDYDSDQGKKGVGY